MTAGSSTTGAPDLAEPLAAGVWTLAGDRLIINEPGGPATILVPTEQVRLLAVDLPLANRAKRLAALPFAIEDLIAEPVDKVHIALGEEIAPKRYLVGVVSHEAMARWIEIAGEAGLGHATLVPDALALPRPIEGAWGVELAGNRAVVRAGDGAGFAIPAALLKSAWQAAGNPPATAYGAPLPEEMMAGQGVVDVGALAAPALDLRQGIYARRRVAHRTIWRRLAWVVALGAGAHVLIATVDTLMLNSIANRRAGETRTLVATVAPGATVGVDLVGDVTNLLPTGGGAPPDAFLPLITRVSGALAPLAGGINVRALAFQADTMTMDLEGSEPSLATRIDAALKASRIAATVTNAPDGTVRITARAA